jgi:hypothetical protein
MLQQVLRSNGNQILYLTEQLSDLSLTLLVVVIRDVCRESWVSTRFKVLHRFRNHIFQRRHLCQPKQLFRFLRLEIDDERDALRRPWLSSPHIRNTKLRCHINLFSIAHHIRRVIVCKTGTEYKTNGDLGKRKT